MREVLLARGTLMLSLKLNKKVGHIVNVFSFVMCPIFFYIKGGFFNEKDQNGKRDNAYLFRGV